MPEPPASSSHQPKSLKPESLHAAEFVAVGSSDCARSSTQPAALLPRRREEVVERAHAGLRRLICIGQVFCHSATSVASARLNAAIWSMLACCTVAGRSFSRSLMRSCCSRVDVFHRVRDRRLDILKSSARGIHITSDADQRLSERGQIIDGRRSPARAFASASSNAHLRGVEPIGRRVVVGNCRALEEVLDAGDAELARQLVIELVGDLRLLVFSESTYWLNCSVLIPMIWVSSSTLSPSAPAIACRRSDCDLRGAALREPVGDALAAPAIAAAALCGERLVDPIELRPGEAEPLDEQLLLRADLRGRLVERGLARVPVAAQRALRAHHPDLVAEAADRLVTDAAAAAAEQAVAEQRARDVADRRADARHDHRARIRAREAPAGAAPYWPCDAWNAAAIHGI
jgi:hypothetical protein